jgi:uncharacterized repeat protein (TIGR01451 family)
VSFSVTATATNDCGTATDEASCTMQCRAPKIEIEKEADAQVVVGERIHYTITLRNPSSTVTLENIEVCDDLADGATWVGNANPAPASQPSVGSTGGRVCWNVASLAPGASMTFTFELTATGDDDCRRDFTLRNVVRAHGSCGSTTVEDEDSAETVIPCERGACRLTGGGCLNENGGNRGHKQHTYGGNVSPCPTGGGPTGDSWQHVVRENGKILFNFHSWEPCITECSVVAPGPCSPHGTITRADFSGPAKYSLGAGSRERDARFEAIVIDHNEGACNRGQRDEYALTVWDAQTNEVVFSFPLQESDCGNLQIHETPGSLAPPVAPAPTGDTPDAVALVGRAYPNPFASSTSFAYEVPSGEPQAVEIGIYTVAGRLVTRLAADVQAEGRYTVRWDGRDAAGVQMAPGVYFLKSKVGRAESVSRLLKIVP